MLRVGLTGGLGSGKTTIASMFATLGAHVIGADAIGHQLMQPGEQVYRDILQHFGREVLQSDGTLDRKKLAAIAFEEKRIEELNRLVHPPVIAEQEAWAQKVFASDPHAVAIVESALIFEAERSGNVPGWKDRFDRIILVTAPDQIKIARYVERLSPGTWNEALAEDARSRLGAQIPDREKLPFCDYVIENTGTREETRQQVEQIYRELQELASATPNHNLGSIESVRKDKRRL
jgi:dephospho-CoA kinase